MAKKHQIFSSAEKSRCKAGRKWRRQLNAKLRHLQSRTRRRRRKLKG